jgi:hypothetical protein
MFFRWGVMSHEGNSVICPSSVSSAKLAFDVAAEGLSRGGTRGENAIPVPPGRGEVI